MPWPPKPFTRLIDDLDGSKAERTVEFSWDGKSYAIDLSKRNLAALLVRRCGKSINVASTVSGVVNVRQMRRDVLRSD